jgi:hypothetical protein
VAGFINRSDMKKVVKFKASQVCYIHPTNSFAMVFPIDHPDGENVSNKKEVITSKVVSVTKDGDTVVEFETLNTKYVINKEA